MMETVDSILAHYGIKGMKWGVRRKRGSDGRVGGESSDSDSSSPERKSLKKTSGKATKSLSNAELKEAVERMNLEKQYSNLQKERNPKGVADRLISEGGKIAANVARQQITNLANDAASKQIQKALKKKVKK